MTVPYAYVWDWWDGTSDTTAEPWAIKRITIGGQPGTGFLFYNVTQVADDGRSFVINGTTSANNPPTLVPPVIVSANDQFFPYQTEITVTAFDIEGTPLAFAWYSDTTFLGLGVDTVIGNVDGTWNGNGTTIIQQYTGTQNTFATTISSARPITVYVKDQQSGTTVLDFDLRGSTKPPPSAGVQASAASAVTTDASSIPLARIGPGEAVDFEVYAKDVLNGTVNFLWSFNGSNNWTVAPVYSAGTTEPTGDGGFKNVYRKEIEGEVVSTGTSKQATAVVRVTAGSVYRDLPFTVVLIKNTPPTGLTFTAKRNGVDYNLATVPNIAAGDKMEFAAVAADPDSEVVEYYWVISQPASIVPSVLRLWGAKIVIDTTGWPPASTLQATVTATDRMGDSIVESTPLITVA